MTRLSEDPRFERLPKWVQQGVKRLEVANESVERRVQHAHDLAERARLETEPETSKVVLQDWHAGDVGLGDEARIRFRLDDEEGLRGNWIECRINKDSQSLEVHGSRSLQVRMNASNTFQVTSVPW